MHALAELSPLGSYMVRVSFKNTIVGLYNIGCNNQDHLIGNEAIGDDTFL
jgi:hypothetical protein